jgi:hypothetical protein
VRPRRLSALAVLALCLTAAACKKMEDPKNFPAEKVEQPKDLEKGEGVPPSVQESVKKGLDEAKKEPKKP